jgi:hypothetical protein
MQKSVLIFYFCTYFLLLYLFSLLLHDASTVEYVQNVKNVKHVKHVKHTMANGRQREILVFYLDEVCSLFILVLMVQIVHTKKPRLTSKQNREQIYVGTVQHCLGAVMIDFQFI